MKEMTRAAWIPALLRQSRNGWIYQAGTRAQIVFPPEDERACWLPKPRKNCAQGMRTAKQHMAFTGSVPAALTVPRSVPVPPPDLRASATERLQPKQRPGVPDFSRWLRPWPSRANLCRPVLWPKRAATRS